MVWEISPRGGQPPASSVNVNNYLTCGSGWSAISPDEQFIGLSYLPNGFECYTLSDQQRIYTVNLPSPESVPTSIIFDPNGSIIFCGSSGAVYIASGTPPAIYQTLKYESKCYLWIEISGCSNDLFFPTDEPEAGPILVSLARHLVVSSRGLMVREASLAYYRRTRFLVTGTHGRGSKVAIRVWEGTVDGGRWLEGPLRFLGSVWSSWAHSTRCLTI